MTDQLVVARNRASVEQELQRARQWIDPPRLKSLDDLFKPIRPARGPRYDPNMRVELRSIVRSLMLAGAFPYTWADPTDLATNDTINETWVDAVVDDLMLLKTHTHDPGVTGDGGVIDGASWAYITDTEVTGAAVADIDFTSLSQNYAHLRFQGIIASANDGVTLMAQINGDTATTYDAQNTAGTGGANKTSWYLSGSNDSQNDANKAVAIDLMLLNYTETDYDKLAVWNYIAAQADDVLPKGFAGGGCWQSTAAITQVTFAFSAGNVDVGSHLFLYGIKDS